MSDLDLSIPAVLRRAADLIEPDGKWKQRIWGNARTCMCAEGAIFASCGSEPFDSPFDEEFQAADRALKFLDNHLPYSPNNRVVAWNDAPERIQAEVVAKLREVADLAEVPCNQ